MQRCKTPHVVVTFHSTADAMAVQAAAAGGVPAGRVIPVPSGDLGGVRPCLSVPVEQREELEQALERRGLAAMRPSPKWICT